MSTSSILEAYSNALPCDQNILSLFDGEWSSKMPAGSGLTTSPGTAALFEDPRISWLEERIGGFRGKRIIELGPLEGGHTYLLSRAGASEIVSIEANSRSFLKCLCVKEVFGLENTKFMFGDARLFLKKNTLTFDICVASGILYHMINPIEFIKDAGKSSNQLFVWTHYYDTHLISGDYSRKFSPVFDFIYDGQTYEAVKRSYGDALGWAGFCGGDNDYAVWLTKDALFKALDTYGFEVMDIGFDHPSHQNGPALAFVAKKRHGC